MKERPLKAFSVLEKDEYTGGIYFATHSITAAKAGAKDHADGDLTYIQCRRAPWADAYAETGVPARVAVDNGWHFECFGCDIRLDSDIEIEHRLPIAGICGMMSGTVFCSPRCKWRHTKRERRQKQEEQSAIEDFKKIVLARFPDADLNVDQDGFHGHHAYVTRVHRTGHWQRGQVIVSFRFPGMTFAPATFRLDDRHTYGPPEAGYRCCNGDREAFEAWAASTRHPDQNSSSTR